MEIRKEESGKKRRVFGVVSDRYEQDQAEGEGEGAEPRIKVSGCSELEIGPDRRSARSRRSDSSPQETGDVKALRWSRRVETWRQASNECRGTSKGLVLRSRRRRRSSALGQRVRVEGQIQVHVHVEVQRGRRGRCG